MTKRNVPNEKEIAALPRLAQVALAARCARRVFPLFELAWPAAPEHFRWVLTRAVVLAEVIAAGETLSTTSATATSSGRVVAATRRRTSQVTVYASDQARENNDNINNMSFSELVAIGVAEAAHFAICAADTSLGDHARFAASAVSAAFTCSKDDEDAIFADYDALITALKYPNGFDQLISDWFRESNFSTFSTSAVQRKRSRRRRLQFEQLEDRIPPTTITWVNPKSGTWSDSSNWSSPYVPSTTDEVTISTATAVPSTISLGAPPICSPTDTSAKLILSEDIGLCGGTLVANNGLNITFTASMFSGISLLLPSSNIKWSATLTTDTSTADNSIRNVSNDKGKELKIPLATVFQLRVAPTVNQFLTFLRGIGSVLNVFAPPHFYTRQPSRRMLGRAWQNIWCDLQIAIRKTPSE